MKHFITLLAIASCISGAYAGPTAFRADRVPESASLRVGRTKVAARSAELTANDFTGDIVTEAPEGTLKHYSGYSESILNVFGVSKTVADGTIVDMTFTEDGKVYWLNPLSNAPLGSYIVGSVDGDKLSFTFPQHIHDEDYGFMVYEMFATMMDINLDSSTGDLSYAAADNQTLELTIQADGSILQTSEGTAMLALSDWDVWDEKLYFDGYADAGFVLTPFDAQVVEVPADVTFENWAVSEEYNDNGKWLVNVGFSGNEVFIKGLDPTFPEWTVKGTLEAGRLSIPSGQYLGTAYYRYNYTKNATIRYEYNEDYGREVGYVVAADGAFTFNYDETARKFTAPDKDCTLLFNEGTSTVSPNRVLVNPTIASQGEITDFTPMRPGNLKAEYLESDDQVGLRFTSPCMNAAGQLFDPKDCGYEIYVDNALFTFDKDVYPRLSESFTEVPYTFSDDYDIQYIPGTDYHYVYFYFHDMSLLGVRMVYTEPTSGTKYYSTINSLAINFSGIENVSEENAEAAVEYYNLQGIRVAAPEAAGIYIRRQGGKTSKVVIR